MCFSRLASIALFAGCLAGPATAATWRPVPGAADIEIALDSMEFSGERVLVWLRLPGRSALVPELVAAGQRAPRVHRTALHTEFDCSRRTMRILAANAYDGGGTPLAMSSTPGAARPVPGADLGWTYDAVCEAARAERRL